MTGEIREGSGWRRIPWWARITIGVLTIGVLVLGTWLFDEALDSSRNSARSAADWVPAFADSTGAIAYCANGYGKGIDNNTPWWEWTLLADGSPDTFAEQLSAALKAHGFKVSVSEGSPVEYGEHNASSNPQHLESIGWATSWVRLDGSNTAGINVRARVADGNTRNNCFPKGGDVVIEADLSASDVVAVVHFTDRSN